MRTNDIAALTQKLIDFRDARDWQQFHNAKDLAAALAIEAAELQELFLWRSVEACTPAKEDARYERVCEEVADVAAYLFLLCDRLDIDLVDAVERKIAKNAEKYPIAKARGNAAKYSEFG